MHRLWHIVYCLNVDYLNMTMKRLCARTEPDEIAVCFHSGLCGLLNTSTWTMSGVACVCEAKLGPDGCRGGVSGSEDFGRPHQFPPVADGVVSG